MIRRSILRTSCALGLSLAVTAGDVGAAFAASRCLTPPEQTAFHVRMLQTELMVATLTCRGVPGRDFSRQYGSFVETNREGLKRHSQVFQSHFRRSFGGNGQTQLDRYVTSLANDYSRSSMTGTGAFCEQQGALFEKAASVQPKDLPDFAAERANGRHLGIPTCGGGAKPRTAAKK